MKIPAWLSNLGNNKFEDFEEFKIDISWFVKATDKVSIKQSKIDLSSDFETTFPSMAGLVKRARVLDVIINDAPYRLLSWDGADNKSCGWLCQLEPSEVSDLLILPEHQLLLDNIGGIKESYNEPEDVFTNNQSFLFIKSQCEPGLGYSQVYYDDMCRDLDIDCLPENDLVTFVEEANGARTLYNISTKQVYLFSHDHCFDYVTFLKGQPEYTYHLINGVTTFRDYVETLAQQWIAHINF
ncbi:MAG: hypothetical protein V4577_29630 [Bacteroidota bacterium]